MKEFGGTSCAAERIWERLGVSHDSLDYKGALEAQTNPS